MSDQPFKPGDAGKPGQAHFHGEPLPPEVVAAREAARLAEWEARPETIEAKRNIAAGKEWRRLEKERRKRNGDFMGPPDPRKGRLPMTR